MLGHDGKLLFGLLDASKAPIVLMLGRAQSVKSRVHQNLEDLIFVSKVITKAIQSRILRSLYVFSSDWESTQLSVLHNILYLLDNLVD